MPHPIERLRWVAGDDGSDPSSMAREAAEALAGVGGDLAGLVTACRRLISRHPAAGPLWWLSARVLAAADPVAEAMAAAGDLESDPTARALSALLPADATVAVVGPGRVVLDAVRPRGDVSVLAVRGPGRRLPAGYGHEVTEVPAHGLGGAVAASGVVVVEAGALGPTGWVAPAGALAAASVASCRGVPVWVVAGAGRVLPARLWEALVSRLEDLGEPWESGVDVVPLDLADSVVGPAGAQPPADAPRRADCPIVPELLRWA